MLDQRRIAGVGNIYADEALFRAGIHPLRPAGRLSAGDWERLRDGIEEALGAGIEAKGASIDDFRHIDGARGSFQDRFLVHRRAGRALPAVREHDPQDRRGGAGDVRVRALPAAPTSAPGGRGGRDAPAGARVVVKHREPPPVPARREAPPIPARPVTPA